MQHYRNHYEFHQGSTETLELLGPLWDKLRQHHAASTKHFLERYETMKWSDRKQALVDKSKALHVEYATEKSRGQLIGYCISSVEKDGTTGEVDSLFVAEPYRKTGLGEELFSRSINWLDEQHVEVQKLSVAVGNEVVLDFYKRFNFHPLHIVLQRKK